MHKDYLGIPLTVGDFVVGSYGSMESTIACFKIVEETPKMIRVDRLDRLRKTKKGHKPGKLAYSKEFVKVDSEAVMMHYLSKA